ncbi:MAG: aldehyde ferredoxin oxidoreductase C-terminal domain-containing protein, partial [Thermodesulfobacteriota bacterium]|nr:aldehyde ferredoxin oxidoreductase C-terminal domain-containing protein [Thermodesulfobacteriota bacterium]
SSLVVCFFARGIYSLELVTRLLAVAGFDLTTNDLRRIGREIHNEKYRFKIREGFAVDTVRIPERIFETTSPINWLNKRYIKEALEYAHKTILREQGSGGEG